MNYFINKKVFVQYWLEKGKDVLFWCWNTCKLQEQFHALYYDFTLFLFNVLRSEYIFIEVFWASQRKLQEAHKKPQIVTKHRLYAIKLSLQTFEWISNGAINLLCFLWSYRSHTNPLPSTRLLFLYIHGIAVNLCNLYRAYISFN